MIDLSKLLTCSGCNRCRGGLWFMTWGCFACVFCKILLISDGYFRELIVIPLIMYRRSTRLVAAYRMGLIDHVRWPCKSW